MPPKRTNKLSEALREGARKLAVYLGLATANIQPSADSAKKKKRKMKIAKMTKQILREIVPGKTVLFELPTVAQCISARSMCVQLKAYENIAFTTAIDPKRCIISITRLNAATEGEAESAAKEAETS